MGRRFLYQDKDNTSVKIIPKALKLINFSSNVQKNHINGFFVQAQK